MNHIISIHGRAAIPLRLLLFTSHWLDLKTIARGLAQQDDADAPALKTYCLVGESVVAIPLINGNVLAYRVGANCTSEELPLRRSLTNRAPGASAAGVFLWCDELQRDYDNVFLDAKAFPEKYQEDNDHDDVPSFVGLRDGDVELHLACALTTDERRWVLEGFESQDASLA